MTQHWQLAAPGLTGVVADDGSDLEPMIDGLINDRVASRIGERDATLWGSQAEDEASKRLAWVDLAEAARPLVAEVEALRDDLNAQGITRIVLCGMGGSSLAPEVICAAHGVELTVLDSSHPDMVRTALSQALEATAVVVSSKSGGTVETDSQRRAFEQAFTEAGIDPAGRIIVVTDPGSPLHDEASAAGYRVFAADPEVGGRYSALTAFGLVPSGLAGANIGGLLDEAASVDQAVREDSADNPALVLGAWWGCAALRGLDKLALVDAGSSTPGFGDWAEQLIAESTGKSGTGVLPVVADDLPRDGEVWGTTDEVICEYGPASNDETLSAASGAAGRIDAPLGAQFLVWEVATAIAGRVLEINPFDQPDVESAKVAARTMLDSPGTPTDPACVDGAVEIRTLGPWGGDIATLADAVSGLVDQVEPHRGYVSVHAYLDRWAYASLESTRIDCERLTGRPATFGWGPRFLHSTGQYHKGGPKTGVYLQITGAPEEDLAVPGRAFTFGELIAAQAAGDAEVLAGLGRPVLALHLRDVPAGLAQLHGVLTGLVQAR